MNIEKTAHWVRLELAGEIDLNWREANAAELTQLLETCPPVVIIDVENVTFIDSMGLGVVALCYQKCRDRAGTLYVTNPQPIVVKAMEAVGLSRFVQVVDSCESARLMYKHLATFNGAASDLSASA